MKIFKISVTTLMVICVLLLLVSCRETKSATGNTYFSSQQKGIWVSGTGKMSVVPDLATLSLGVAAQESTVTMAQDKATRAMNNVISALKTQGIADKDIQTQRFSIQQVTRYDQPTQKEVVVGYLVTNIVEAKIRFDKMFSVGAIIDSVAQAGGDLTRVNGLSFSVEDPTQYYEQLRTEAVKNAQQAASQLARLNEIVLGNPTFVSEGGLSTPPILPSFENSLGRAPGTPISPGEAEINLTVQVAYDIIP